MKGGVTMAKSTRRQVMIAMEDARKSTLYIPLGALLEKVRSGRIKFHLDDEGFIHLNDNGTQVIYHEIDNLCIPMDLVSRA
jgi:hypothetical protein